MRPLSRWALFLAVPLVLMLAVSAAASTPPAGKVKWTKAGIETVAMDGSHVAYSTELNAVYSWDVRSGRSARLARPSSSAWPQVHELAIAGKRVAWIARDVAGNSQETNEDLYTASVTGVGLKKLGHAFHGLDFIEPQPTRGVWLWRGDWITGLVGSGKLLAVSRWTTTPTQQGETKTSNARLSLISPSGLLRPIAAGEGAIVSRSADGGRVAVLRPQGGVAIYSAAGTLLRELNAPAAKQIALSGDNLVVLTETSTLSVYNWRSGRLTHNWRVPNVKNQVFLEDAFANTAVYSVYSHGRNLHLLQLNAGKDLLLVKGPGLAPDPGFTEGSHDAQLEAPGLVYAASKPGGSKLVFVPMARVLGAVSKGHVR